MARRKPDPPRPSRPRAPREATAPETTPCPRCGAALAVRGDASVCPACGLPVRFVDAPERPCNACGKRVALLPGREAVRCAACGAWQAVDERRPVVGEATCPRCGRDVEVPLEAKIVVCRYCQTRLALSDGA